MMHLTAMIVPTATGRPYERSFPIDRHERKFLCPNRTEKFVADRLRSIFLGRVANSLELRCIRFHYSVIDGDASISRTAGFGGGHPLNDAVPAMNTEAMACRAAPRSGVKRRLNPLGPVAVLDRKKKDLYKCPTFL